MKSSKIISLACAGIFTIAMMSSCVSMTNVAAISPNTPIGSKTGVSTQYTYLGFIGKGGPEQSIKNAAANGGIKTVTHVEHYDKLYFLGIVAKHEIRVYGE